MNTPEEPGKDRNERAICNEFEDESRSNGDIQVVGYVFPDLRFASLTEFPSAIGNDR